MGVCLASLKLPRFLQGSTSRRNQLRSCPPFTTTWAAYPPTGRHRSLRVHRTRLFLVCTQQVKPAAHQFTVRTGSGQTHCWILSFLVDKQQILLHSLSSRTALPSSSQPTPVSRASPAWTRCDTARGHFPRLRCVWSCRGPCRSTHLSTETQKIWPLAKRRSPRP